MLASSQYKSNVALNFGGAPDSGTKHISVQLHLGLPDRQKSGGQNGQQHLISPDPQHWCSAGLYPQPTLVLPVHCNKSMKLLFQLRGIISLQIIYCLIKVILIFDL